MPFRRIRVLMAAVGILTMPVRGGEPESASGKAGNDPLLSLSLEALMGMELEIVSKKSEAIGDTPAAVSVLTADDIRRSGATTIPEALKLVPGLNVYQRNPGVWSIGVRGFNQVFANKLLVLIDGRSVYSPLFSGVYWDVQDTVLEDINRIEIIRGPGATVWGANAVNGVINIVTKSAKDTQGGLVTAAGGTEAHGLFAARYGGRLSESLFYRIYGKFSNYDSFRHPNGTGSSDSYYQSRGGFRMDWHPAEERHYSLQSEIYGGRFNENAEIFIPGAPPATADADHFAKVNGGHVIGRAHFTLGPETTLRATAYYDRAVRETEILEEIRDTGDVELQLNRPWGENHALTLGAGYRVSVDDLVGSNTATPTSRTRTLHRVNAYVQDQVTLIPDRLRLTLGSKFDFNDFTGLEVQPGARLAWQPWDQHLFWSSVSRAVRTPSRTEHNGVLRSFTPGAPLGQATTILGDTAYDSEELWAYELGWRAQLKPTVSVDLSTFYNVYDNLRSTYVVSAAPAAPPTHLDVVTRFGNDYRGEAYGGELSVTWQAHDYWRLIPGYNFTQIDVRSSGRPGVTSTTDEVNTPHHQLFLRSQMNLSRSVEFDTFLRYVDETASLPAFLQLDLRLAWRPAEDLELAVIGRNLLDNQHPEVPPDLGFLGRRSEVERSVYGRLTWRF